jgi:enoyl-CoA hydratase/carnithine racemase
MLETERIDAVLRITLNRPEKRNALCFELCRKLVTAFEEAEGDPAIRTILLTAQGTAFCAGMDLSEIGAVDEAELSAVHHSLFTIKDRVTKPIVAAINGDALGGGVGLVANAHIVVACPRVAFGLTEIRIGLWPFLIFGSVSNAVGKRLATEWSLTGRMLDSDEARIAGLVQYVSKNAYEKAFELARCLANSSRTAIRSGLTYVRESEGKTAADAGQIARRYRVEVMRSEEFAEGLRAFREKRSSKEC